MTILRSLKKIFHHSPNSNGAATIAEIRKNQICLNKLAATQEENSIDPRGKDYLTASAAIRKKYRDNVGFDCPMCDGKKVTCPKFIGVDPSQYKKSRSFRAFSSTAPPASLR